MNKARKYYSLVTVVLLAASAPLIAQEQDQKTFEQWKAEMAKVPLTEVSVKKVIISFARLKEEFVERGPSDAQELTRYLRSREARDKAEAIIREAGFSGWQDWYLTFGKTMQTFMAYRMQHMMPERRRQAEAIEDDSSLTVEQKRAAAGLMAIPASVSEADLQAIKPYIAELEKALKSGNG